jgi:hypothetical protein
MLYRVSVLPRNPTKEQARVSLASEPGLGRCGINKCTSLTTENVTVQQAGDDDHVEQMSTIVDGDGTHVSMVCHIFSVVDGVISGVRADRNERGIPAG